METFEDFDEFDDFKSAGEDSDDGNYNPNCPKKNKPKVNI